MCLKTFLVDAFKYFSSERQKLFYLSLQWGRDRFWAVFVRILFSWGEFAPWDIFQILSESHLSHSDYICVDVQTFAFWPTLASLLHFVLSSLWPLSNLSLKHGFGLSNCRHTVGSVTLKPLPFFLQNPHNACCLHDLKKANYGREFWRTIVRIGSQILCVCIHSYVL